MASLSDKNFDISSLASGSQMASDSSLLVRPVDAPLHVIRRSVAKRDQPMILESTLADPKTSRWSIFAADPVQVLSIRQREARLESFRELNGRPDVSVQELPETQNGPPAAIKILRRWLNHWNINRQLRSDLIPGPFAGGVLGWVGYDFGWHLEKLPRVIPDIENWDDLRFGIYDTFVIYDHRHSKAWLVARNLGGSPFQSTSDRLVDWQKAIEQEPTNEIGSDWPGVKIQPVLSRSQYESKIAQVLDYIVAGDIFQANFTQRFEGYGEGNPVALFENLARISPAPFAAFSQWDDKAILCSSPEWFYRLDGDLAVTRPIKGTRPRGLTPEQDAENARELLASPKDRAELTMIVDLERNDLGRVCEFGSIRVTEALKLETYAQVHHLVAEIQGRLQQRHDTVDLLAAMFPGGSITGAPKIRAMEIIEGLETHRRGPYTGAIGYMSVDGRSAWNIPIRTILNSGDCWSYHVGGGIVVDSDPGDEYAETMTKGRGMHLALETPYPLSTRPS